MTEEYRQLSALYTGIDLERAIAHGYAALTVQWRGPAPSWFDLECRVCGHTIKPATDAVETGRAPFHGNCWDALAVKVTEDDLED